MARYRSEMLEFGYRATLHITHAAVSPEIISSQLGREPRRQHSAGEARRSPSGTELGGAYPDNYWDVDLETIDGQDIVDFLERLVSTLAAYRDFLRGLSDTGGEITCFIGIFTSRCCAQQLSRQLLGRIADLGLDLRLDFYGSELPQKGLD